MVILANVLHFHTRCQCKIGELFIAHTLSKMFIIQVLKATKVYFWSMLLNNRIP